MTELAILLLLTVTLSEFEFFAGAAIQALPIPRPEWKAHGPMMVWDGIVGLLAVSSLSAIQLLMNWLSSVLNESLGGPFSSSTTSFALIQSQLASIDSALILLVAGINSTVILEPVASLAVRIVGPGAEAVTSALILWVAIQIVESIFLKVWIYFFVLGLVFFSVPFRLGRRLGTYLMSWSMLTAVALPLLPSLALSLEGTVGYETFLKNFLDIGSRLGTDPLAIPRLIASLPSALAGLIAAVIIALIVFPIAYLFMMSLVARSLAELLGGSSAGPSPAMMILTPSRQFAKELTG